MNQIPKIVAYIPLALPLLGIAVAIPLIMRKVPPNWWYGFRTRKTLSNRDIWYEANYLGGVNMVVGGVAALIINAAVYLTAPPEVSIPVGCIVAALSMGIAASVSLGQVRKL